MEKIVKVKSVEHITHDVLRIVAEKPEGLTYTPGQATDISINRSGWEKELRTFTFTSLPDENHIEFTIKTYPSHKGVTNQLLSLKKGDELIIHDVYGSIKYKGEGIFLAGGAGVTPFIAIFKQLEREHKIGNSKLIFANKTRSDIIDEGRFKKLLGKNFINILSEESIDGYEHGYISTGLIKKNSGNPDSYYYICGPDPMMDAIARQLSELGIPDKYIVKEAF